MRRLARGEVNGWLRQRVAAVRSDHFLRRLTLLSGSVAAGQAFVFLCTPIISRLYTPEDFGHFAAASAVILLTGGFGLGNYPKHLPLCRPEEATASLASQLLVFGAVAVVFVASGLLAGQSLAAALGLELHALWLTLLAALLQLVHEPLSYLLIRDNDFARYSRQQLLRLFGQGLGQILTGLLVGGTLGLLLGLMVGQLLALFSGGRRLVVGLWSLRPRDLAAALPYMRREWRYPAVVMPAALLTQYSQAVVPLLVAMGFGPQPAGMMLLAGRLFLFPIRLLGNTTSQVLLADLGAADHQTSRRLVLRVLRLNGLLALMIIGVCMLINDGLWTLVLGEKWAGFASIVRLLAVYYGTLFVFESVRSVFLRDNKWLLLVNRAVPMVVSILVFGLLPIYGLDFHLALALYAGAATATTSIMLWWLFRHYRN